MICKRDINRLDQRGMTLISTLLSLGAGAIVLASVGNYVSVIEQQEKDFQLRLALNEFTTMLHLSLQDEKNCGDTLKGQTFHIDAQGKAKIRLKIANQDFAEGSKIGAGVRLSKLQLINNEHIADNLFRADLEVGGTSRALGNTPRFGRFTKKIPMFFKTNMDQNEIIGCGPEFNIAETVQPEFENQRGASYCEMMDSRLIRAYGGREGEATYVKGRTPACAIEEFTNYQYRRLFSAERSSYGYTHSFNQMLKVDCGTRFGGHHAIQCPRTTHGLFLIRPVVVAGNVVVKSPPVRYVFNSYRSAAIRSLPANLFSKMCFESGEGCPSEMGIWNKCETIVHESPFSGPARNEVSCPKPNQIAIQSGYAHYNVDGVRQVTRIRGIVLDGNRAIVRNPVAGPGEREAVNLRCCELAG